MAFTPGSGAVISFVVDGAQTAQRQIERIGGSFGELSAVAKTSLKELAAFAGIGLSLGALTEQVMSAQREFDKINASLVTATGSTANASQAFKALQAFAATTPYSVAEATEAFIKMRNLGLDPSEKALRAYGNTAAAMGKGLDQMVEAVADAATGEFERLKEFGIKAKQNGDEVSLTFQGVTRTIGNNAKEIEAYLQGIGETNFGDAMEARAATLDGAISNLGDAWESTMRTIAQNGIGEAMQSGVMAVASSLADLSAILDAVAGSARKEGESVKEASLLHVALTTVFEAVAVLGVNVAYVFTQVGKELGGLAAQANAVAHGDLAAARAIGEMMKAEAEQARKDVDAKSEAILGAAAKAQKAAADAAAAKKASGKDDLAQYKTVQSAAEQAAEATRKHADAMKKYATAPEQLAEELKKLKGELGSTFTAADEARVRKHFASMDEGAKKAAEASSKEKAAYAGLSSAIGEKIEQNKLELASGESATESQKMQIKLDHDLASGKLKLSDAHLTAVRALLSELAATEDLAKAQQGEKDGLAWMQQSAQARNAASASLAAEYELYGKSADARDIAMVAVKAEADLEKFLADERSKGIVIGDELEAQLRAEKDMRVEVEQATLAQTKALAYATQLATENKKFAAESISDPQAREQALLNIEADTWRERIRIAGEGTEAQKKLQAEFDTWYANRQKGVASSVDLTQATALLDIMSALDEAAQSAAQGMADSFGRVGSAIGGLTTALSGYGRTQAAIAAQLAAATKDAGGDQTKVQRANAMAAEQSAQAQVKSYGDMASAAKDFFSENSAGYKVLEGVEKAYRAAEMAMALESMAQKIFFKESEVAANTALNATKLTGEAASTAASTGLAATEASAWGVTAVVKAIASLPFPYNLAAGAATLAAVVAVGAKMVGGLGGGSVSVSEQRQAANGTGSILGDSNAKSESISKSLDLIKNATYQDLAISSSMLTVLQSINAGINGLGNILYQTDGFSTTTAGTQLGSAASLASSTAFNAVTGGIIGLTLDKLTGGWISSTLGKIGNSIFGGNVHTLDTGVTASTGTLGQIASSGVAVSQYADTKTDGGWFSSDKYNTQLASLGSEVDDQFTKIFIDMRDAITEGASMLGLCGDAFTAQLNSFVVDLGKISTKDMSTEEVQTALQNALSKVSDDMAKFAVAGLQQFQDAGEGAFETLARIATEYQTVEVVFDSFGKTFGQVGLSSMEARERLIDLAGGLDEFASQGQYFLENFFSEQEQAAALKARIDPTLAQYGLSTEGDDASQMFRDFVVGLDTTTEAGAQAYTALMSIAPAFKTIIDTASDVLDERTDLQDQLDQLTMTSAELLEKQRDALDASNQSLFDQVQAAQAVRDAQDEAKTSLGNFITQMKSFATTAAGLNNNLVLGGLSTLTPEEQYAEARRQFEETRSLAAAGDSTAQGNLSAIEQTFLQLSQQINGSDAQYSSDLATVMQTNDQLAQWATDSVDVAQASLDALNDSSASLTDISATLTAIAQGVQYLPAALTGQDTLSYAQAFAAIDYSSIGTSNMTALVDEIKALRTQVADLLSEAKGRRSDAQQQTGAQIQAAETIANKAAETVVDGVREAVTDAAYAEANSTRELK
jgi:hypothetical protein